MKISKVGNLLLTFLSVVTLFTIMALTFPTLGEIKLEENKAYLPKGAPLSSTTLSFKLLPELDGVGSELLNGENTLTIPYFLNKRYIVAKSYLPLIGHKTERIEIFSLNKYNFEIKSRETDIDLVSASNSQVALALVITLLMLIIARRVLKFSNGKFNYWALLSFTFAGLILLRAGALIVLLTLVIFALSTVKRPQIKFTAVTISLATTFALVNYTSPQLDYSGVTTDKIALEAVKIIKEPKLVPQGIKYVEEANKTNGQLNLIKCHQSLHALGLLTYLKFRDPVKTMASTITNCEFGYLHGSEDGISLLTTGVENSKEKYQAGCDAIFDGANKNTFFECIHGSGHAFYELYAGDYMRAYKACEIWGKDTNLCQVAVTMSMGDYLTSKSQNASLPQLCLTIVDAKAKDSCVISAFRYVLTNLTTFKDDLPRAGKFCSQLSNDLRESCYFSIGDALAYQLRNHFDIEKKSWGGEFCQFDSEINQTCYMTYIRYMSYYHALFRKPLPVSYYCGNLPFMRESCESELLAQENRPAN